MELRLGIFVIFDGNPFLNLEIFLSKTVWKNCWGKNLFWPPLLNVSSNKDMNPLIAS
jgi:hypothetical protein